LILDLIRGCGRDDSLVVQSEQEKLFDRPEALPTPDVRKRVVLQIGAR
jgi:hypothetical protein